MCAIRYILFRLIVVCIFVFFFFKQKTAYEMRISDWSSDVCSSDLELKKSPAGQTIRVRAADGTVFLSLGPNYGRWLTLRETPQVMQDAMVAVEDRRFRYHPGVDPVGMARAAVLAVQNYGTGRRMQGASTITQQLARNIFLSNSYTWARKMREMVLSLALAWKFSNDAILELYFNTIYL